MAQVDRIGEFLQRLSPLTRSCLLTELERLELGGVDMPGSTEIQARLRAEFRKDGSTQNRTQSPSRYFFTPLEPFLFDGAPTHTSCGRLPRGSLAPIWEWICRDLLPTMARDFNAQMKDLIAADKHKEATQAASIFQTKVEKYLESTIGSAETAGQTRLRLATYTAAPSAFDDLVKMQCVLRSREALAKFSNVLPKRIVRFDDQLAQKVSERLDKLRKNDPDAVPFAITLVANLLKPPWQIMRLATKASSSKNAADVAVTPYAVSVSMVLDRLEDRRAALRVALKHNRVVVAKALVSDIYDTEYALRVRINRLDESEWGARLHALMESISTLIEDEIKRFPDDVGHVLGSRRLRGYNSLSGKLTYLAWRTRDAISDGASFCRKLITAA
ncbi:MAG: hypothetical protein JOY90_17680 [Bradyrhizobium sp.]|uniref:hypothetical protein n=1 Tax=Bradyrhizobium sp. TaxID=376 RepID=UPI001DA3B82F|nr:hypothetical protein [Bradyrhizobium sp.]MBV9562253.1 hypothetical protein [Bradyrhizobium sp.]